MTQLTRLVILNKNLYCVGPVMPLSTLYTNLPKVSIPFYKFFKGY